MNCGANDQCIIAGPESHVLLHQRQDYFKPTVNTAVYPRSSPLLGSFAAETFLRKVPNDEERGKTVLFASYRLFHVCSNTWIRLLLNSHTTILPSLRIAVENGLLNSPLPLPSLPNFVTNFPLSSNT